jgi:hypothetical protein
MMIAEADYERNKKIYEEQEKAETLKRETEKFKFMRIVNN